MKKNIGEVELPKQYEELTEKCTVKLVDAAEKLWPIISELGGFFVCGRGDIIIRISSKKDEK